MLSSLALSVVLLTGCEKANFSLITAPDVSYYSDEVQSHAADELETLGPACPRDAVYGGCSAVVRFVLDYLLMRDQTRAAANVE